MHEDNAIFISGFSNYCGVSVRVAPGWLSPVFGDYSFEFHCTWVIFADATKLIELRVTKLKLATSWNGTCYDKLLVGISN